MMIEARTAEILTTRYLRTIGNSKQNDLAEDSAGSAAIALFQDILKDGHDAGMEPELAFDFGVLLGVDAAIAACTLAPDDALKTIAARVQTIREMFADFSEDPKARVHSKQGGAL